MKLSVCHYSFHRRWKEENWTLERLCEEVKVLGVNAVDFHAGLIGEIEGAVEKAKSALAKSGIELSGFSLSTNFNLEDQQTYNEMIDRTLKWMRVAVEVGASVSRIFGGTLKNRLSVDEKTKNDAFKRVIDALGILVKEAEKLGLVLAIENHGGLPCTAEEQVYIIEAVNSKYLRATIDIGNYMACGQEAVEGTRIASRYCAYVHIKDFKKKPDPSLP
ncbi:sugar phosphate isomerase/epimerase, partial [bacterium]|nr:sugar phosphate isomerase/epimerase [bacterium]